MSSLARVLLAMMPTQSREWGLALLAEREELNDNRKSTRWLLGAGRIVATSWFRTIVGGELMKTVLVTLSVVNGAMGLFLVGLYFLTDTSALPVIILALGLILQGGYTLVYLFGRLERIEPWSGRTLLVGETLALVLGGLIFVASGLNNIAPQTATMSTACSSLEH